VSLAVLWCAVALALALAAAGVCLVCWCLTLNGGRAVVVLKAVC